MLILKTESAEHTSLIGYGLGETLVGGEWVCLYGNIGAGKTMLVKGLARGLGVEDHVTSPTFALMNEYPSGRIPLYHIDAYRMSDSSELEDTGVLDYLPTGVVVVEWAELVEDLLAGIVSDGKRINIGIEYETDKDGLITHNGRTIRITRR